MMPALPPLESPMTVSLATWNINSVRLRLPLVLQFLEQHPVDVLCLQEIKCLNEQFPRDGFAAAGYPYTAVHGQKGYHGHFEPGVL
jgi:exodeoxyribonuclease-3